MSYICLSQSEGQLEAELIREQMSFGVDSYHTSDGSANGSANAFQGSRPLRRPAVNPPTSKPPNQSRKTGGVEN
jgi:hypothetical protein